MTRRQQIIIILLFFLLSSAVLATAISGNVLGQATIPTRTPTPDPEDPTDPPPEPTDDDGDDNTPRPTSVPPTNPPPVDSSSTPSSNATNTPIPSSSTPVATRTATTVGGTATPSPVGGVGTTTATESTSGTATPFGGVLAPGTTPVSFPVVATAFPTAQICGEPPTFTTLITALVYSGPGNEYELVETLAADETRPIVGRAIYTSWWLIQLDGKFNQAWINDRTGKVDGHTANVPEVPAPAIDDATPTPGVRWDPTPVYDCELTPTSTATGSENGAAGGTTNEEGQDPELAAQLDTESDQRSIIAATAAPLDIPSTTPTPSLLPIAGLVLIIAAVFVALFLRRNTGGGEPSP